MSTGEEAENPSEEDLSAKEMDMNEEEKEKEQPPNATAAAAPTPDFTAMKQYKSKLTEGINKFNMSPKRVKRF
jgi:hypothetical protein